MKRLRLRVVTGLLALVAASAASGSTSRPPTGHIVFASNRGEANLYYPDLLQSALPGGDRSGVSHSHGNVTAL